MKLWAQQLPEAVLNGRVELKTINFFEQSPVSGCNFYYVCHASFILVPEQKLTVCPTYPAASLLVG